MNNLPPHIEVEELSPQARSAIKYFFPNFLLKTEAVSYFIMVPVIVFIAWINFNFTPEQWSSSSYSASSHFPYPLSPH